MKFMTDSIFILVEQYKDTAIVKNSNDIVNGFYLQTAFETTDIRTICGFPYSPE